ncbi:MAG: major facilitator superfamily 1 [Gemmatimonadetes bacterium]|nr:major facilitator superfamily 1 [Gemmatimonadota bacterium]
MWTISSNLRPSIQPHSPTAREIVNSVHVSAPRSLRSNQARVAATSFLTLFSIVGIALYGLPFFYDFMVRDFGWSRAQVTSGNALSKLIVGPLLGFAAGWFVDRFGPRRLMIAGILMVGTALIGLGSISTLSGFYFFYLFNAVGYLFGGPLPIQVLLSRWFTAARGRAMGFAYLGIGLGGTLVPLVAVRLVQAVGWHDTLRILGVAVVVIALPFALFVKESPDVVVTRAVTAPVESTVPVRDVIRQPSFYLLALGSMCSIAAVGGANQHLKLYLSIDHGYSQAAAAGIASLTLAASLAGRLLMGWLADRWAKKHVMLLIYVLVAVALPIPLLVATPGAITVYAIIFGLGLGGEYMVIPLMAAELFGVRVLGRAMGLVLAADGVAEALSPVMVGKLHDMSGNYVSGFSALIGFAVAGAIAISLLPSRPVVLNGTRDDGRAEEFA